MSRLQRAVGVVLLLALWATGPVGAAEPAQEASAPDALKAAVERLRPYVEELERREGPPTAEELERLRPMADDLAAVLEALRGSVPAKPDATPAKQLRQAQRLLARVSALDLAMRSAEIRARVEALVSRDDPPTPEEAAELRRAARAVQARLLELEAELGSSSVAKDEARQVEQTVALARTVEVLADAEQKREAVEPRAEDPRTPRQQDAEAVETAAEELQAEIERVDDNLDIKKASEEPEGLRRARSILNALFALDVAGSMARLLPHVQKLEAKADPPSVAELESLEPLVTALADKIGTLEKSVKADAAEELPPELVQGRDLLRRASLLDLARAVADQRPVVEAMEAQTDRLTPEEISGLLEIPEQIRPKIRAARGATKAEAADDTGAAAPAIAQARDLLQRVQALVPENSATAEESRDSPETRPVAQIFRFYGSLRARMLVGGRDDVEFDGQTSRIGVRAEHRFTRGFLRDVLVFTRGELGFNFLDAAERLLTAGDPGGRDQNDDSLFFLRLAFVGVETVNGRLSFGKQWSAYYDVAVFSDQMPFFAGAGTGTYPAGTDGGVAGTGRAEQALQYRHPFGPYKVTVQTQLRNISVNDRPLVDTYAFSFTRQWSSRVYVGGAFNKVLDGVPEPEHGEPKEGDQAAIIGSRYKTDRVYAASTLSIFRDHETDDEGRYFSGIGLELYSDYLLTERLKLRGALSYVRPEADHPGDYEILALTAGLNFQFTDAIRLVFLTRIDASTRSDGSKRDADLITLSVFYNF